MPVIKTFRRDKTISDLRNSIYAEVREFGNLNEASQGTAWKRATVLGLDKDEARTFVMDAMDAGLQARKTELDIGAAAMRPKKLISAVDVKDAEEIRWLVPGWIPLKAISEIAGAPGAGKSLVALDFAASLTRGQAPITYKKREPVNVAYLAPRSEDDADILKARFVAAGGNLDNMYFYNQFEQDEELDDAFMSSLAEELDTLDIGFLVFDTISAWKQGDQNTSSFFRTIIRAITKHLNADRACLLVHHFRKQSGGGSERTGGSWGGNVGGVRSLMTVGRPNKDEDFEALCHAKSNYSAPSLSQKFELVMRAGHPAIKWCGPIPETADELASQSSLRSSAALKKATKWLEDLLEDGPMLSVDVEAAAHADDAVSWQTVQRRAKALANVESYRDREKRMWRLRVK